MASYCNNGTATHCDLGDYLVGDVVTADGGCWHSACDVVYVRPVGTPDKTRECDSGDSDGDGWCDFVDICPETPNVLQGHAFLEPHATCANLTLELNDDGYLVLDATDLDNGASDNCSIADIVVGDDDFDCYDVGETMALEYTVLDGNANIGTCITNVTILDATVSIPKRMLQQRLTARFSLFFLIFLPQPPHVLCQDISISLGSDGIATIDDARIVEYYSFDACGIDWMQVTPHVFTCDDVDEPQPIVLAVMDVNGNEAFCDATATVINKPPVWGDPLSSGMTVLVEEESISFAVNVTDPEGQNITYSWSVTCSESDGVILFFTHAQMDEAHLSFPAGSRPHICEVDVEVCDVCHSCMAYSTEFAVVDPSAGSISGNGWFDTSPSSFQPHLLFGTTSFEFYAEYEDSDATQLTGEMKTQTSNFEFQSTSLEWLVVTDDDCAKLKGVGTIVQSGASEYGFLLT
ncbi:MAG: hypothetical protein SGARI_003595, partial [Bacillariaceae sp.]